MAATQSQLEAVLDAAEFLLGARQDQMLTLEEWVGLARAVAAARGRRTAEWLTERDLEEAAGPIGIEWDEEVDGRLPDHDDG